MVVRDGAWGGGAAPYSALTDPSDAVAGRFVVSAVSWVWNTGSAMGQERLGDRAAIAVDPTDSQTVYVAWADRPAGVVGNTATIHVRRSTNGGSTWSADLRTIAGALNPNLAVNVRGQVGFSFQQLVGAGAAQTWQTHFQQSTNGGATWSDFTLSNAPSNTPVRVFGPYLGDYTGLTAVGKDFYGIFSASNAPVNANFPQGVTYQRGANFMTNTLLDGGGAAVAVSIDPFFFRVKNQDDDDDFYVRDWTDSATVHDTEVEPSTRPWFFGTSDVWNRRKALGTQQTELLSQAFEDWQHASVLVVAAFIPGAFLYWQVVHKHNDLRYVFSAGIYHLVFALTWYFVSLPLLDRWGSWHKTRAQALAVLAVALWNVRTADEQERKAASERLTGIAAAIKEIQPVPKYTLIAAAVVTMATVLAPLYQLAH